MAISHSAATTDKLHGLIPLIWAENRPHPLVTRTLKSSVRSIFLSMFEKSAETIEYLRLSRRIREVSRELSWHHSAESSSRNVISSYFTFALAFLALSPAKQTIIYHVVNSSWGYGAERGWTRPVVKQEEVESEAGAEPRGRRRRGLRRTEGGWEGRREGKGRNRRGGVRHRR